MSNTIEANVSFVEDMMSVAKHSFILPLMGGAIGASLGDIIENKVSNDGARSHANGQISNLQYDNHLLAGLAHKAKKVHNSSAGTFLIQQEKANNKQITSIRAGEPNAPGTGVDILAHGGGAILGAVAIAAFFASDARSKRKRQTKKLF